MMRSLYSGVSGLKTHQIKMDVIGNNIANVNTTAYKSQSITFTELMYQTTQSASGPNATTGTAGRNAKQIGLGVMSGAISTAITSAGASQTTGNPFDIKITGDAFFIVNNGKDNYFTRDGSFYVDAAGNLATTANGYNVMGWGVDPETMTIKQDTVKPLKILSPENMTYPPEATTKAYVSGILDKNDTNAASSLGKTISVTFFDNLGYEYTAKFAIKNSDTEGKYSIELTDILDTNNNSLASVYNVANISEIASFGTTRTNEETYILQKPDGLRVVTAANTTSYYKVVDLSEAFESYETKKVPGAEYSNPKTNNNPIANPTANIAAGTAVTMTGNGKLPKEVLERDLDAKLIYVAHNSDNTINGGKPYYYYEKDDGTGNKTAVTLGDSTQADYDKWKEVLSGVAGSLDGLTVEITEEGNINYSFTQEFTTSRVLDYRDGNFEKKIDDPKEAYGLDLNQPNTTYEITIAPDGTASVTRKQIFTGNELYFDTGNGEFVGVDQAGMEKTLTLDFSAVATNLLGDSVNLSHFDDIVIDFSAASMYNNNGTSTITMVNGDKEGLGSGRKLGELSGVSIQKDGMIYASYDNGQTRLLGQIAVATFANASGLEKEGDNLYSATLNSGTFDGIGVDITAGGGYMSTGVLEMSNVDLSSEFTEMITTQRGFQANSRIITVSDTLLEELVNLKR